MQDMSPVRNWLLPTDLTDQASDEDFEPVMAIWPVVAALAWEAQLEHGRGVVVVDDERGVLTFQSGAPCACHDALVAAYNPEREVVVALVCEREHPVFRVLAGWPAPPDAFRITPGARWQLTAH